MYTMDEKYTITIQVTAEQGEKIFKLLAGKKSRQAKHNEKKRAKEITTTIPEPKATPATTPDTDSTQVQTITLTEKQALMKSLHPGYDPSKIPPPPPKQPEPEPEPDLPWHVYEVEPSLYPKGVRSSLTLLVSTLAKADMKPAYQDLSGVDPNDPSYQTLLDNGNRFYASEVESFATEAEAVAFAKQYASEEGIDYDLPTKYRAYYAIAPLT